MKIAQIAPLWKEIPPKKYGGTELIVSLITEGLVKRGHHVVLFASGGTKTKARLVPIIPKTLYKIKKGFDFKDISYNIIAAKRCFEKAEDFDIIHSHLNQEALVFAPFVKTPVITTLHSSLPPDYENFAREMKNELYVSISQSQRRNAPYLNYIATIYHGIEVEKFKFNKKPKDYLFFLGSMMPEKGPDIACQVARRLKMKLFLAGDIRSPVFFNKRIKPYLGSQIKFVGELSFRRKVEFFRNAKAFIFPVRWNEAFGLVIPESLASGTPVISSDKGAMPEIIDHGKTGFIIKGNRIEGFIAAIKKIEKIDRGYCRKKAKDFFSAERMVSDYERLYTKVIRKRRK